MGHERHDQDSHTRSDRSPKLTMIGRLSGTVHAQPWTLRRDANNVKTEPTRLTAGWLLRTGWIRLPQPLRRTMGSIGARLSARIGRWHAIGLGQKSFLLRPLLPGRGMPRNMP